MKDFHRIKCIACRKKDVYGLFCKGCREKLSFEEKQTIKKKYKKKELKSIS
jgi:hypothetical protein